MSFALFYNYTISVYYWIPYVMHDFMNIQVKIMGNMATSMSKSKKIITLCKKYTEKFGG